MSDDSKIEWTDATWNPIRGCSRVSEGCRHCYAESVAARFSGPGLPYEGLAVRKLRVVSDDEQATVGRWTGVVRMVPEHLTDPLRWRRPRRVFVNSMSDLFHESLTNEQIAAVFGVMAAAGHHSFQVLTKRARRMREWFAWAGGIGNDDLRIVNDGRYDCTALNHLASKHGASEFGPASWRRHCDDTCDVRRPWPLRNVWLGVSAENQAAADERIPDLLATPAAVRWISAEPLLGEVDVVGVAAREMARAALAADDFRAGSLDWVVAGCESGHGARPAEVDWFRSLRDQCAAAGVAFFLKQAIGTPGVGVVAPSTAPHEVIKATSTVDRTRFTDAITPGPGSKRKAGGVIGLPYLDGVQHAAMPGGAPDRRARAEGGAA